MTQRDVLRPGRVLQDLLCLRFRPFGVGLLLPEFLRKGSLRQNEGQQDERSDAHGASCVQRLRQRMKRVNSAIAETLVDSEESAQFPGTAVVSIRTQRSVTKICRALYTPVPRPFPCQVLQ